MTTIDPGPRPIHCLVAETTGHLHDGRDGRRVTVPAGDDFDTEAVAPTSASASRDFKVPQHIAVRTDALPRSPGAKVLKKQLCEVTESEDPLR
jgi:hypothetical protein